MNQASIDRFLSSDVPGCVLALSTIHDICRTCHVYCSSFKMYILSVSFIFDHLDIPFHISTLPFQSLYFHFFNLPHASVFSHHAGIHGPTNLILLITQLINQLRVGNRESDRYIPKSISTQLNHLSDRLDR